MRVELKIACDEPSTVPCSRSPTRREINPVSMGAAIPFPKAKIAIGKRCHSTWAKLMPRKPSDIAVSPVTQVVTGFNVLGILRTTTPCIRILRNPMYNEDPCVVLWTHLDGRLSVNKAKLDCRALKATLTTKIAIRMGRIDRVRAPLLFSGMDLCRASSIGLWNAFRQASSPAKKSQRSKRSDTSSSSVRRPGQAVGAKESTEGWSNDEAKSEDCANQTETLHSVFRRCDIGNVCLRG